MLKTILNWLNEKLFPNRFPYKGICKNCKLTFQYRRTSGMSLAFPHFYCNKCSNVFHCDKDFDLVMRNEINETLLAQVTDNLPTCPCGGRFMANQNPKCPHCNFEFKSYLNALERLNDPYLILIKGAKIFNKKTFK